MYTAIKEVRAVLLSKVALARVLNATAVLVVVAIVAGHVVFPVLTLLTAKGS